MDNGIKRPDNIRKQVLARQEELQRQGENVDGDIAHARQRLVEVDQERAFYQRQAARGKITEQEFDVRMEETKDVQLYWQGELDRLKELRDDAVKVKAGLDFATNLLNTLQEMLPEIDISPDDLKALPEEKRNKILERRRKIIRALVEKVQVWADGRVKIHGLLDGSEAAQFRSAIPSIGALCYNALSSEVGGLQSLRVTQGLDNARKKPYRANKIR